MLETSESSSIENNPCQILLNLKTKIDELEIYNNLCTITFLFKIKFLIK